MPSAPGWSTTRLRLKVQGVGQGGKEEHSLPDSSLAASSSFFPLPGYLPASTVQCTILHSVPMARGSERGGGKVMCCSAAVTLWMLAARFLALSRACDSFNGAINTVCCSGP